jgi:hypothetical protein
MHGTAGWPIGVQPISLEDLDNLGIDRDGMLYWAGRPMVMTQRMVLSWPLRILLALAITCATLGGLASLVTVAATLR